MSWFKVHRGWMDNEVFARDKFSRKDAWLWLIEKAQWEGGKTLGRGQISVSVRELETAWKWPKSTVSDFLRALKRANMIRTEAGHHCNILTICNYDKYQSPEECNPDTDRHKSGREPDTGRTPIKEGKKEERKDSDAGAPGELFHVEQSDSGVIKKPTPNDITFGVGLKLLMGQGASRDSASKFLGRLKREYGEAEVARAVTAAVNLSDIGDAKAWLTAAVRRRNGTAPPPQIEKFTGYW